MTREEAIERLNIHKSTSVFEDSIAEAIDMAIEALSQPIVCKDYCIDDDHIYCSPKVADRVVEALSADALLKQEIDFHKEVSRIEAEKVVDLEHKLADMVSVVRCKDCRHRDLFSCPLADNDFQKDEDFCSWGERQGGADECV